MRISHFERRSDGSDGQVNGARVRSASRQERIARAEGAKVACYTWPMQSLMARSVQVVVEGCTESWSKHYNRRRRKEHGKIQACQRMDASDTTNQ